jgi:RNA polymerase sigma-70 factor (ECF subfamily)
MQHADGSFLTTRWSLVLAAGGEVSILARRALDDLCRMYWYPLYCYVRRRGHAPADAEDLVQGFFVHLFDRELFAIANRSKGKLRGFLLSSLQFFLADERKRAAALKRGGAVEFVPLDMEDAEGRFSAEPAASATAESSLDRAWGMEVLKRAANAIGESWRADGKGDLFDELSRYLLTPQDAAAVQKISERFHIGESNVKVSLHRLRERYRDAIRKEVAETVSSEEEIDAEIAALREAVSR